MNKPVNVLFIISLIFLVYCGKSDNDESGPEKKQRPQNLEQYNAVTEGLKDYYDASFFDMGVAVAPNTLENADKAALIKRHFNSLTAENAMKWSSLQPSEGSFSFSEADKIVDFGRQNGMKVRGHTLVWHNQVPDWVFEDNGATASKELVIQRLRTHITEVMNHYKGKVYAWDVVNEVIDDGSAIYRTENSRWFGICGEDFIFEAFKTARQVDPGAKLFYNDYSAVNTVKRDKIYNLLKKLKDQNLVDGMGMQGHWNIEYPANELLTAAIEKYASLGIEVQITELDVSIYPNSSDPESDYTSEVETKLTMAYSRYFNTFRNYKDKISSVTFWGLTDDLSWLNFRSDNRKNYPLLFDKDLNPKQAYFSVINF